MSIDPVSDSPRPVAEPDLHANDQLLLVGEPRERESLMLALDQWSSRALGVDDVGAAIQRVTASTAAILLFAGRAARERLGRLLDGVAALDRPVVLLVEPDSLDEGEAAELYDAGAAAVLAWPAESLLLPRLLDELVAVDDVALAEATEDVLDANRGPLEHAVRARLVADVVLDTMGVRVIGGTAILRGTVASAWERARLRRLVETVPGIARVVDHGVAVQGAVVPDEELRTVVDATLRSVGNAEAREMEVQIDAAIVTLRGVAGSRDVGSRVCNAIRRIPGIRRAYDATVGVAS